MPDDFPPALTGSEPGSPTKGLSASLVTSIALIGIRGMNTLAKFALALYTARYLGLSDLGLYGLMVAITTILPSFAGLGTTDWIVRRSAGAPVAEIAPLVSTRLAMSLGLNLCLQALASAINAMLGAPMPWSLAALFGVIVLLEHLAADCNEMVIYRGRVLFGNALFFCRAGLWPLAVIAIGLLVPEARNLHVVLVGWIGGLLVMWIVFAVYALRNDLMRHWKLDWPLMLQAIRSSRPFYLKDLSIAANLYLDRFLVSLLLGLELAGVYTFFWSVANVVHNLSLYAIFQPQVSRLMVAAREGGQIFRNRLREAEMRTTGFAIALSLALAVALPPLLPYLNRDLLGEHLTVFWIILVATILRLGLDSYNFVLVALHRDRALALISLAAVPLAAALYAELMPLIGLDGAAVAYLLTGALLLIPRIVISRKDSLISGDARAKQPG